MCRFLEEYRRKVLYFTGNEMSTGRLGGKKDITPYGATFQPLDLKGYQKEKALLYVSLRDAYELNGLEDGNQMV